MRILGIDPGVSGGAALLDGRANLLVAKFTTPTGFVEFVRALGRVDVCFIEKVSSRPGQGVASTFTFGSNYGLLQGVVLSHDIPMRAVTPQAWQRALGAKRGKTKTQHKNNLLDTARQLFPRHAHTLATCDAVLIAEYGRRLYDEGAKTI